jgi:hypothetical protein
VALRAGGLAGSGGRRSGAPLPAGSRPDGRLAAMNQVIAWAGFLGAWLLVAGPTYQGAIECLTRRDPARPAV